MEWIDSLLHCARYLIAELTLLTALLASAYAASQNRRFPGKLRDGIALLFAPYL